MNTNNEGYRKKKKKRVLYVGNDQHTNYVKWKPKSYPVSKNERPLFKISMCTFH